MNLRSMFSLGKIECIREGRKEEGIEILITYIQKKKNKEGRGGNELTLTVKILLQL